MPAIGALNEVTPPWFAGSDAEAKKYQLFDPSKGAVGASGSLDEIVRKAVEMYGD